MKRWFVPVVLAVGLAGCSKDAESLGSAGSKSFQSADPAIKAQWEAANAAVKTNGYAEAIIGFKKLQSTNLSPEQRKAVDDTVTAVSDQMYEAANKGEAAAVKAVQRLREVSGR